MPRTRITPRLRQQVEALHGRTCWLCWCPISGDEAVSPDHVQPVVHGGSDELHNLRPSHARCNLMRSDWDVTSYYAWAITSGTPERLRLVPAPLVSMIAPHASDLAARAAAHYAGRTAGQPLAPLGGSWGYTALV